MQLHGSFYVKIILIIFHTTNKDRIFSCFKKVDGPYQSTFEVSQKSWRTTDYWETLIIYLISSKLDSVTSREWESGFQMAHLPYEIFNNS